jgi:hypothetical protein
MITYSQGSKCLAGAAPLEHRVPVAVGSFCTHLDIAQWVEQQPEELMAVGSTPTIHLLCKQRATTSDPGWAPAPRAR